MDLLNLTREQFLELAEEEGKASINIGRRPHPSAFPKELPLTSETSEAAETVPPHVTAFRESANGTRRKAS